MTRKGIILAGGTGSRLHPATLAGGRRDDLPDQRRWPGRTGLNGGTCGVPDGASAVLINLVSIAPSQVGNFRAYATGSTPTGGVLNFAPMTPAMNNSNAVVVPLSPSGQIDLFANTGPNDGTATTHARGVILGYYN